MSNKYLDIALEKIIKQEVNAVLDKIRDEIIKKYWDCDICKYTYDGHFNIKGDINDILQIIDKYKVEK